MRIYSGRCCLCDVGIPTRERGRNGNELYSGDVVQLWHGSWIGTESEQWLPSSGLTAIVGNQYQSYTGGRIELITDTPELFTMGIASVGIQGEEWKVTLVKSHKDIVDGERILSFGLNWKEGLDG